MLYLSVGGLLTVMVVFGLAAHWTVVVVVAVLAWGLCGSAMPTTFTTWVLGLAPADPEAVTSLLVVAVNFGLGAGALLGGRLLDDVGPHGVVWGAAMVLAVALGALFAAVRRPASA